MMNAHASDSHFGPPSELIDVKQFIDSWKHLRDRDALELLGEDKAAIETECSLDDVNAVVGEVCSDLKLSTSVYKNHEDIVSSVHATVSAGKTSRKRRRAVPPDQEPPEVVRLRARLDKVLLKSWQLTLDAGLFIRPPKNSDHNVLTAVKGSVLEDTAAASQASLDPTREALLTITIHNRLVWGSGYLSRSSQHAVLASQTLGDLFDAIPCSSNEMPMETLDDNGGVVDYDDSFGPSEGGGSVICIEGVAYGDGQAEEDYSVKLLSMIESVPEDRRPQIKKGAPMHDVRFDALSIRVNEPYWLLHNGNCEHFLVVDQIRLMHPSDPREGYPLALHITPPLFDLCRACAKVPASLAIIGDIRLGESPCVLCWPCWRNMGKGSEDVLAVPLPKHELGW